MSTSHNIQLILIDHILGQLLHVVRPASNSQTWLMLQFYIQYFFVYNRNIVERLLMNTSE